MVTFTSFSAIKKKKGKRYMGGAGGYQEPMKAERREVFSNEKAERKSESGVLCL